MSVRWSGVALATLLLVGCPRRSNNAIDAQLPEQAVEVPDVAPRILLEQGAGHLDPTPRARALYWLIRESPDSAGGDWGVRALYDPSAWVQRAGVEALSTRLSEPETHTLLEEFVALGQADPYTRSTAGALLATVGSTAARDTLAKAWRAESEPWMVAPLALASAAHGDPEAVEAVSKALASGEIGLELPFLAEVGASGHHELQAGLREGVQWAEDELILPFAVAMVELGDPSGEQVLRKALEDPSAEVRLGVLDLLVGLDHQTATALLEKARNDDSQLVRWYARLALGARGSGDAEVFQKAWLDPDREVRQLVLHMAARAGTDPVAGSNKKLVKAIEQVVAAGLDDSVDTVRLEAVRAAATLDIRSLAANVAALTAEPWDHLRIEAAGTAVHLGYTLPAER